MPFRQPPGVGPTWPVMDSGLQQATPATPLRGEGARAPRLTTSALATDAAGSPASQGRPASAVVNSKRGTAPARSRRNSKEAPKRRSSKKTRGNRGRRGARSTSREFRPASSDAALASAATKRASESAPRLNVGRPKVVKRLNRSQRARLQRHKTAGVRAFGKNIVETSDAPPGMLETQLQVISMAHGIANFFTLQRLALAAKRSGLEGWFLFRAPSASLYVP